MAPVPILTTDTPSLSEHDTPIAETISPKVQIIRSDDLGFRNDNVDYSCGWASELPQCPDIPGRKLVGVDGKWYDVTDFISRHPGGPIIEEFIGRLNSLRQQELISMFACLFIPLSPRKALRPLRDSSH